MFSYSKGYYVSPPDDQYLKFKNRCSLLYIYLSQIFLLSNFMNNSTNSNWLFLLSILTLWNEKIRLFIGGRQAIARKYRSYHAVTSFYSTQTARRSGDSLFIAQKYIKKSCFFAMLL